ncbi:MAG: hypothetical protein AB7E55_05100 [Pigmentiphaga sp.]
MNDTLKAAGRIGAELGAAKAENEKLRGLLREAFDSLCDGLEDGPQEAQWSLRARALAFRIKDALSQQPEPTDTFTAVDMATAAAQGFRDGQAAVEPAPAQDERKTFEAWAKTQGDKWLIVGGLQWSAGTDDYASARTNAAWAAWQERAALSARPAQTEQQPAYVECRECTDCGHVGINDAHQTDATCAMCDWSGPSPVEDQCPDCGKENVMGAACPKCSGRYRILAETHVAAPIAQTAPQAATSDQYRAELYDEVWGRARSMGYVNVTDALIELERMKAAPQPEHSGLVEVLEKIKADTRRDDPLDHYDMVCRALASYRAALSAQGGEA